MYQSEVYLHIAKRANYFGVNKTFFMFNIAFASTFLIVSSNLLIAVFLLLVSNFIGSYISKKDPDFFDIYLDALRFKLNNPLHKIKGKRVWEA